MQLNELPYPEQENLAKIAGECLALKDRLEAHSFRVVKFQVFVSPDEVELLSILPEYIGGVFTDVKVDSTLPAGTINVAALVQ